MSVWLVTGDSQSYENRGPDRRIARNLFHLVLLLEKEASRNHHHDRIGRVMQWLSPTAWTQRPIWLFSIERLVPRSILGKMACPRLVPRSMFTLVRSDSAISKMANHNESISVPLSFCLHFKRKSKRLFIHPIQAKYPSTDPRRAAYNPQPSIPAQQWLGQLGTWQWQLALINLLSTMIGYQQWNLATSNYRQWLPASAMGASCVIQLCEWGATLCPYVSLSVMQVGTSVLVP